MRKLCLLGLPANIFNWIISFLAGRTQYCKVNGVYSAARGISLSIVQGSGIGPCLYIVMESDLNLLSRSNILINVPMTPTYWFLSILKAPWLKSSLIYVTGFSRIKLIYTVSQKTVHNCFCQKFVKFSQILLIFGRNMAKSLKLCEVHSFSTSPNLRHHTTVLNADVPNWYTTLKVVMCNKLYNDLISTQ